MIFDDTKELLKITEDIILDAYDGNKKWLKRIDKILNLNSLGYIHEGLNSLPFKRVIISSIIFFLYISIFIVIKHGFNIQLMIVNAVISVLLGIIFAPVAISSKSLDGYIKSKDIEKVRGKIIDMALSNSDIDTVKENLALTAEIFESKVKISRWIIAAMWAVFIYFLTQCIAPLAAKGESVKLGSLITFGIMMIFIFFIHAHERCFSITKQRVFATLRFALNEQLKK